MRGARAEAPRARGGGRHRVYILIRGNATSARSLGPLQADKVARRATPLGKKLPPGGYNTHSRRGISLGEIPTRGIPLAGILTHNTPPNRISVPVAALWVIRHMCTGACGCAVADVRYVGDGALDGAQPGAALLGVVELPMPSPWAGTLVP